MVFGNFDAFDLEDEEALVRRQEVRVRVRVGVGLGKEDGEACLRLIKALPTFSLAPRPCTHKRSSLFPSLHHHTITVLLDSLVERTLTVTDNG